MLHQQHHIKEAIRFVVGIYVETERERFTFSSWQSRDNARVIEEIERKLNELHEIVVVSVYQHFQETIYKIERPTIGEISLIFQTIKHPKYSLRSIQLYTNTNKAMWRFKKKHHTEIKEAFPTKALLTILIVSKLYPYKSSKTSQKKIVYITSKL